MILAQVGTFWMPVEASTFAQSVDSLFYFIYYLSVVCFVPMMAAMAYFVVKHRRRSPLEVPRNVPAHHMALELTWTILPSFIVVFIFVWGFYDFMRERTPPEGAYVIRVKAQKWKWTFEYPEGLSVAELHVPKDRPVHLLMTSADVLHSLYIPAFRAKMDVVPGRYNELWFNAILPTMGADGQEHPFPLYCTEYCGAATDPNGKMTGGHSEMKTVVFVHEAGAFDAWFQKALVDSQNLPPVEMGAQQFNLRGCSTCHSIDGSVKVGPSFKDLWGTKQQTEDGQTVLMDENYARQSILEPAASIVKGYAGKNMPSFKGVLSEKQIDGLFAYMESLSEKSELPKRYSLPKPVATGEATGAATGEATNAATGQATGAPTAPPAP